MLHRVVANVKAVQHRVYLSSHGVPPASASLLSKIANMLSSWCLASYDARRQLLLPSAAHGHQKASSSTADMDRAEQLALDGRHGTAPLLRGGTFQQVVQQRVLLWT